MISESFSLAGKTALITGAGSGLGRAGALALAEAGARVIATDLSKVLVDKTVEEIADAGGEGLALELDVTSEASVSDGVSAAAEWGGALNVVVNNAGVGDLDHETVELQSSESWARVLDVNLNGTFRVTRAALPFLVDAGSGAIVNVASVWGLAGSWPVVAAPAYAASKGAIVNFTRELALEYAEAGIRANALCPGTFRSGFASYGNPEFVRAAIAATPMARLGNVSEIAAPLVFLASDAARFMTGQTLVVDGGLLAR